MLLRKSGIWGTLAVASLMVSGSAYGALADSAHDFSDGVGQDIAGAGMCAACHTPHAGTNANTDAPLWNHADSTVGSFSPYTSPTGTLNATVDQPLGISLMCLSCHDGVTALDSFGGGTGAGLAMSGTAVVGSTLTQDHPVSFTYDAALVTADNGGLAAPPAAYLFGTQMECASCHDVHGTAEVALLRINNDNSELCTTCHTK